MYRLGKIGIDLTGRLGFLDIYSFINRILNHHQLAILKYHRVDTNPYPWFPGAINPNDFEKEIAYICRVAEIVPLDWMVKQLSEGKSLGKSVVALTFDDGYKDNYTIAYPILKKYKVPATIFLTTGYIGTGATFWECELRYAIWNTKIGTIRNTDLGTFSLNSPEQRILAADQIETRLIMLPREKRDVLKYNLLNLMQVDVPNNLGRTITLSWDEVYEMNQNGISFGAHTVTHPILLRIPIKEVYEEVNRSKREIEERLNKPCTLFAYPNGDFNNDVIEIVRECGFITAVTTVRRSLKSKQNNLLLMPRIPTGADYYIFKVFYSGLYSDLSGIINLIKFK